MALRSLSGKQQDILWKKAIWDVLSINFNYCTTAMYCIRQYNLLQGILNNWIYRIFFDNGKQPVENTCLLLWLSCWNEIAIRFGLKHWWTYENMDSKLYQSNLYIYKFCFNFKWQIFLFNVAANHCIHNSIITVLMWTMEHPEILKYAVQCTCRVDFNMVYNQSFICLYSRLIELEHLIWLFFA